MDTNERSQLTREEGLAIAKRRKAARHRRTTRIRKAVAILAISAFIGPFGFIYGQLSSGNDPALKSTAVAQTQPAATTTSASNDTSATTDTAAAAPVTTQQS